MSSETNSGGTGLACTPYNDTAPSVVVQGANYAFARAAEAALLASDQIASLNDFTIATQYWDASWNSTGTLSGFIRPDKPTLDPITPIAAESVPDVQAFTLSPVVLDTAPVEPAELANIPELDLVVAGPDAVVYTGSSEPTLDFGTAPTEPVIDLDIAVPELVEILIATAPTVTIPEFTDIPPVFDAAPPSGSINFTELPYASTLRDEIQARIEAMMAGEGLPPAIATAIYDRMVERDDRAAVQAVQEVREEFASRGWEEPTGMQARRMMEVRFENRTKRAAANRDVLIQEQNIIIENVRFAVSNGLQLEGQYLQLHLAVEQRKFELAVKTQEVALAVFNAHVAAYNAEVAGFNAIVTAYNAYIDGQKSKVEVYKAQVDAAKTLGEYNQSLVAVYESQIRAEVAKISVYTAQIDGYKARIEAELGRVQAYKTSVDAYSSFVEAYKAEWQAEQIRISAQVSRGEIYKTIADVYGSRVEVWKTKSAGKFETQKSEIAIVEAGLANHDAQVKTMLARVEAAKATLAGQVAQQQALLGVYTAEAGVESTAAEVDTREFTALNAREAQRVEVLLKDAELKISQMNQNANLLLRALESATQASTQLTASAMSTINMSAGINSSAQHSESCSTNVSFSGEIADIP